MKTFGYLFYVGIVFVFSLLQACSDDNFGVESDKVTLRVGETLTLKVKHASGSCAAEAVNPAVVKVAVQDGNLELFGMSEGSTVVRLTDSKHEAVELHVTSVLELKNAMWVIKGSDRPAVIVYAYAQDVHVAAGIWDMLEKNLPFSVGKRYAFVQEGESGDVSGNIMSIYYQFKDGELVAEREDGEKYACTIIQRTKDSMTTQEDLTEHFRLLYPDAGITDVKRIITWTRFYNPL